MDLMVSRTNKRSSGQKRKVLAAAVVLCVTIAPLIASGAGAAGGWRRTRRVAPGVFYTKIKDPRGPYRIHILSVKLSKPSTLDVVLAGDKLPGTERTTSMARRSRAIAAINGDFAMPTGRPVYDFARDGELDQTTERWGGNFSVDSEETSAFIGRPKTRAWTYHSTTGATTAIDRVNSGKPLFDEVGLFTPVGADEEQPPLDACSARLLPGSRPQVRTDTPGVDRAYVVDRVVCRYLRLKKRGGVVLATPQFGPRSAEITSLVPGQQVVLGWSLGWMGVLDSIGGNPTLVGDGQIKWNNVRGSTPFHGPNPRTGVGATSDGRVLLVAVDGRRPGYSVGMTTERFAHFFLDEGATSALNLDGGGSTTFVLGGDIKNRPSDGAERPVSSALVLLPRGDPGEQPGARRAAASIAPAPVPGREIWDDVVSDPGSTGGLASFLAEEGVPLGPVMRRAARTFEASR